MTGSWRSVAIALACPRNDGVPLIRWSLRRLRRYLLRRRIVRRISVEGLRQILHAAGVTWQHLAADPHLEEFPRP